MFLMPVGDDVDHRDFPLAGTVLILANVMVFLYMLRLAFGSEDLKVVERFYYTWGLVPADLMQDRFVGVVTHMFLHAGICHIAGNMICLWAFVHGLERILGTLTFAALFVLWGVVGGLAHAATHWGQVVPLVGASGAIAGMIGAYWMVFGPFTKIRTVTLLFTQVIKADVPTGIYAAIWVFMQVLGSSGSEGASSGVAWFAHLGGFAAGALTMAVLKSRARAQLVITRHGELHLEEVADPAAADEEPVAQLPAAPIECPYCGMELGEGQRLAANLLRCPNLDCDRCIFLEEMPAGAGSS